MPRHPSNPQAALLQALWVKANGMTEPLELRLKTKEEIYRLRHALYQSVSMVKKGQVTARQELRDAIDNVMICVREKEMLIRMERRDMAGFMDAAREALELKSGQRLESAEEIEAREATERLQRRLQEEMQAEEDKHPAVTNNPFASALRNR